MKKSLFIFAPALLLLLGFNACKEKESDPPPAMPNLYTRVGGTEMIADPVNSGMMIEKGRLTLRSVVDSSILVIASDAQMAPYFAALLSEVTAGNTTGLSTLSRSFTNFMSTATGSTNPAYAYNGMGMKDAHDPAKSNRMGLKTDEADFNRFVGHIGTGLAKNGVTAANNAALVNDLVALLNTTKADIVQR